MLLVRETYGLPLAVISVALPAGKQGRHNQNILSRNPTTRLKKKKLTTCPRILSSSVPVLSIKAECEEVEGGVKCHTWRRKDGFGECKE